MISIPSLYQFPFTSSFPFYHLIPGFGTRQPLLIHVWCSCSYPSRISAITRYSDIPLCSPGTQSSDHFHATVEARLWCLKVAVKSGSLIVMATHLATHLLLICICPNSNDSQRFMASVPNSRLLEALSALLPMRGGLTLGSRQVSYKSCLQEWPCFFPDST